MGRVERRPDAETAPVGKTPSAKAASLFSKKNKDKELWFFAKHFRNITS